MLLAATLIIFAPRHSALRNPVELSRRSTGNSRAKIENRHHKSPHDTFASSDADVSSSLRVARDDFLYGLRSGEQRQEGFVWRIGQRLGWWFRRRIGRRVWRRIRWWFRQRLK